MSLHAAPSPEALERLHSQRRNSTISSIFISVLLVVLTAVLLGIFLLPSLLPDPRPEFIVGQKTEDPPKPIEAPLPNTRKSKPTPPASMHRVMIAHTMAPLALPEIDLNQDTASLQSGFGDDFGDAWPGDGPPGGEFTLIPPDMQKRCSRQDRLDRLARTGGTPECEDAVIRALKRLKATQSHDGSWGGNARPSAMTGLAILAYLGHCETPKSADFGDSCLRAISYLVDIGMKTGGRLSTNSADKSWPYEHAIATYALGEASTFCKQGNINIPNLFEITRQAGQLIIDNQHSRTGGWDYAYDTYGPRGGDLSVTAWQIQALKACQHANLELKGLSRCITKALRYVDAMQCGDGGFAYSKADESPHAKGYRTMTGAGLLCLQMWGKGSHSSARRSAGYIEKNTRFDYHGAHSDLYGHYYEAQAMMNRGGEAWRKYNELFRDQLLESQLDDGTWPAPGGGQAIRAVAPQYTGNTHYRTCLNTLMLEVYYRFLPATSMR